MQLDLESHKSLEDLRGFLAGSRDESLVPGRKAAYAQIGKVLRRFSYWKLGRADKGLVRRYLREGELRDRRQGAARRFRRKYRRADILLLAEVDELHGTLSGPATRKLCERAWKVFGDARFERLAGISNGHVYNLRRSRPYTLRMGSKAATRRSQVAIGERRRPRPGGRPGWVRVDSVHQGDLDNVKGVYHINAVDTVTQYQFVGSAERIAEWFLLPVLEGLLESFPFRVRGFHSDNGSES